MNKRGDKIALITVSIGPLFWAIDSFIKAFVFDEGNLLGQLFAPAPFDLWLRLFIIAVMGVFGFVFREHNRQVAALQVASPKDDRALEQLRELSSALQQKEQQLKATEKLLLESRERFLAVEDVLQQSESQCSVAMGSLRAREEEAKNAAQGLAAREQQCKAQEERLKAQGEQLKIQEEQLKVMEAALARKAEQVKSLEQSFSKKQDDVSSVSLSLREMEEKLKAQNAALAVHSEKLKSWEASLAEREALVSAQSAQLSAAVAVKQQKEPVDDTAIVSRLFQAGRMAAIGQFASGVVLEVNSPLSNILNNVQLIKTEIQQKGDFNPADLKSILGVVEESAVKCKNILQSIAGFSRMSGQPPAPLSLNEVSNKMIALVENRLKLQSVAIKKQFQLNLPLISADAQMLQLAIFNLIVYAKWSIQKKSAQEGGTITFVTSSQPDTHLVELAVSDTGMGIAQENIPHVFEPFYITGASHEEPGLDLSFVETIIKDHQGTVTAEHVESGGTVFRIQLPAIAEK